MCMLLGETAENWCGLLWMVLAAARLDAEVTECSESCDSGRGQGIRAGNQKVSWGEL